ncbi:hypothetical protein WMY93_003797 [Mugilogobius chulae]|uniref:Uncharacterized protein n=1 Tax=Mugilogobius chulae TaxID=88201 RepID=A0AAW0Q3H2_9GOBI
MGTAPSESSQALEQAGILCSGSQDLRAESRAGLSLTVPRHCEEPEKPDRNHRYLSSSSTTYNSTQSLSMSRQTSYETGLKATFVTNSSSLHSHTKHHFLNSAAVSLNVSKSMRHIQLTALVMYRYSKTERKWKQEKTVGDASLP